MSDAAKVIITTVPKIFMGLLKFASNLVTSIWNEDTATQINENTNKNINDTGFPVHTLAPTRKNNEQQNINNTVINTNQATEPKVLATSFAYSTNASLSSYSRRQNEPLRPALTETKQSHDSYSISSNIGVATEKTASAYPRTVASPYPVIKFTATAIAYFKSLLLTKPINTNIRLTVEQTHTEDPVCNVACCLSGMELATDFAMQYSSAFTIYIDKKSIPFLHTTTIDFAEDSCIKTSEYNDIVEYTRAEAASKQAKYTQPIAIGRGAELSSSQQPWHPGKNRAFGFYKCQCGSHWTSAYSWTDTPQSCKECGNQVLPHRQKPLEQNPEPEKLVKPHMQDLCGKCQKLGRLCTLSMEQSAKPEYPDDVVVKGLPLDITKEKLLEIFRSYGSILRIHLPEPKPEFSHRIAFITFQNAKSALQKFNEVDVPTAKLKY